MAFHIDQRFDRGSRGAPDCKVGKLAIGNVAPDQQAACPQSMTCFIEFVCIKIGEFEVASVMQSRPFRAFSCRQALPIGRVKRFNNLGSGTCEQPLLAPGSKYVS